MAIKLSHMRQYLGKGTNYLKSKMYSRAHALTKKFIFGFSFYWPTDISYPLATLTPLKPLLKVPVQTQPSFTLYFDFRACTEIQPASNRKSWTNSICCLATNYPDLGKSGVNFYKFLLASERSERDTIRGNSIEISLYIFIYLSVYGVRETSVFARAFNYVS